MLTYAPDFEAFATINRTQKTAPSIFAIGR
jgi:hypothetical protein